jgi:hypothetical protein
MRRFLGPAALALLLLQSAGCVISPRAATGLAHAALLTAVVATEVAILASHDAHYHSQYCGHPYRYYSGHTVYYYGGHWEYYEAGSWYVYGG